MPGRQAHSARYTIGLGRMSAPADRLIMPDTPATLPVAWDHPDPFILPLAPLPEDIDGLNHVNNAVYVHWCERAGWAHSANLGLTLADYRRLNRAMAIRRGEYDYRLPARLGDALELGTWITATDGKLAMERRFQLVRPRDGATLLYGRWDVVCIELSSGRPTRMPPEFCAVYHGAVVRSQT